MSNSKNDIAWEKLFTKYNIIEEVFKNGHTVISSTKINEYREARLMTKFDHKSQLPKLFSDNDLSILPISRGGYIISTFETFQRFDENEVEVSFIDFPHNLESLDHQNITSESTAINCAYISLILQDFTGEAVLTPTVSGRMSSSDFDFVIDSKVGLFPISISNSQVEIDGGFEGEESLILIEAKNYLSDDFLIRQMYYPYRLWRNKIRKKVRSIFLTYSNGIFHLREYDFINPRYYNSLQLINQKKYSIQEGEINIETIEIIINKVKVVEEPKIPFPQADSFERVINLCELLNQKETISKDDITMNYDFDTRQTDYYANACKYLGLIFQTVENDQIVYKLNQTGKKLFTLNIIDRQKEFIKLILSHSAFKRTLELYLNKAKIPTKDDIVEIMKDGKLYNITQESTYRRRASTILSWINWIINLT